VHGSPKALLRKELSQIQRQKGRHFRESTKEYMEDAGGKEIKTAQRPKGMSASFTPTALLAGEAPQICAVRIRRHAGGDRNRLGTYLVNGLSKSRHCKTISSQGAE
jgi:hypothetical protein